MGSSLAPILDNLFTEHHEKASLENYLSSSVLSCRRYVDDKCCLFDNENDALLFFDYINSRHPNLRFTIEREVGKKFTFSMF